MEIVRMNLGNRASAQLLAIVEQHDLREHPFYKDWEAGLLTQNRLAAYAADWGEFISLIPAGWRTLSYDKIAAEEETHTIMWMDGFAASLHVAHLKAHNPKVLQLIDLVKQKFSSPNAALGALFAFEAQQPATSKSKLAGLPQYGLGTMANLYFQVHADEGFNEAEILAHHFDGMTHMQQQTCLDSCRRVCGALWDALTGLHGNAAPAPA